MRARWSSLLMFVCVAACDERDEARPTGSRTAQHPAVLGGTVLEVRTELDGDGLALRTNVPADVVGCRAVLGAVCRDDDLDGLADAWEDVVLDRMRPFVVIDEDEAIVDDAVGITGIVGRVSRVGDLIHVYMMLGWSKDYGRCGLTAHRGDSERVVVALELAPSERAGDARVVAAYTAAHEGAPSDRSRVFVGDELKQLSYRSDEHGEPRWTVFASSGKHATYATAELCESASALPCIEEDCGPTSAGVEDFTLLMPFVNAGEEHAPRAGELTAIGFAGEEAWDEQRFCGGLEADGCASPVRDKLLVSPF